MRIIDQLKNYKRGASIIMDWLGAGGVPVDKETAQKRAAICIACQENVDRVKLTGAIADSIREAIEAKNHLRLRVDGEKRLGTCSACSCVIRLKVWTPISTINHGYSDRELVERFPATCWQRIEQNL